VYWNFFLDFGPLNLGQTYRFCELLNRLLAAPEHKNKVIYYYSSTHSHRRTNSVTLMTAWALIYLGRTPEEAFAPFEDAYPAFPPFHDASPCVCSYKLTILDCLRGIKKAMDCGFVDFNNFNIEEFEHFEKVENGDLTWLSHRTCAFAGPHNTHSSSVEGYYTLTPEDYVPHFKKRGVGMVIRLNKKYYDEGRFTREGIQHRDLYYLDGSTPTEEVLQTFLGIMEAVDPSHKIAVHCKAGLGRTGSCIGAYWMKHYGWTAAEVIGWMRVCRPGMVIGPQQHWMERQQEVQWRAGDAMRSRQQQGERKSSSSSGGMMSPNRDKKQSSLKSPHTRVNSKGESQGDFLRSRRSPKAERR